MNPPAPQALQGLRIIDLSRVLAGPWCTQMLGDLGADVIKVEHPLHGDDTRHWGPPFDALDGSATYFQCANRNKRSLALDFSQPEGASLLRQLVAGADVLVENFRPGTLARHGLDPLQLLAEQPRLIVCSISGFGQHGPLRERAGYDLVAQALGGLMSVTGSANGDPSKCGVAVADLFTGLHAVVSILAAIRHRDASGEGQWIDLALLDAQLAMLANLGSQWLGAGVAPGRHGNAHPSIAPYESFACADGDLVLAVGNDAQFQRCCAALALPALAADPRFASNRARLANRDALREALQQRFVQGPRSRWSECLAQAGVPAAAVQTVPEALDMPHTTARDMLWPFDPSRPDDRRQLIGSPLKLSRTPPRPGRPPPRLGEHSEAVLAELGVDTNTLARLRAAGVVGPMAVPGTQLADADSQSPPGLGMDGDAHT